MPDVSIVQCTYMSLHYFLNPVNLKIKIINHVINRQNYRGGIFKKSVICLWFLYIYLTFNVIEKNIRFL